MPDLLCSSRRFGVHGFSNTPNQQLAPNHLEARTHPSDSPAIGKSSDDQQPSAMFIIVGAVTTQVGALNTLVPCLDQQLLVVGHGIVTDRAVLGSVSRIGVRLSGAVAVKVDHPAGKWPERSGSPVHSSV